jgi:hypothetical protein
MHNFYNKNYHNKISFKSLISISWSNIFFSKIYMCLVLVNVPNISSTLKMDSQTKDDTLS